MMKTATECGTDPRARAELARRGEALFRTILKPPPRLTLSEWADKHRRLSPEGAAEVGQWRTDRVPYLREIMDTVSDPLVRRVCWMAASQVAKTETVLNAIGFHVDQDPAPVLVLQPNEKPMGMAFSKDRLAPMLRDTPRLRGKVKPSRARDSGNTLLHKTFPGGHLTIAGANSPAGLASRPIRIVLLDEIDRYPPSAGAEGDPVSLAEQRAVTFWNRKVLLISTPTIKDVSRIEQEWKRSDQRRYFVPCPHCGHMQPLVWGGEDLQPYFECSPERTGIRWDTDLVAGERVHRPTTAAYLCVECATLIPESAKRTMVAAGEWRVGNPDGDFPGFHISALYSPWTTWPELVTKLLSAKRGGRDQLKTFVNLQLGEPFDEASGDVAPEAIARRRETYVAEVPMGVGLLTGMVDIQKDRLELLVVGWGEGEESWRIAHHRLVGDPAASDVWGRLERLRTKAYLHESGATLRITMLAIDSGYKADHVYRYVAPRQPFVVALKGSDSRLAERIKNPKTPNADGVKVRTFNASDFKDTVFSRLRLQQPGPGYMHFPSPRGNSTDDPAPDLEYLHQFTAEVLVKENHAGQIVRRYKKREGMANEAIDLEVGALVALHVLGPVRGQLGQMARDIAEAGPKHVESQQLARRRRRMRSKGIER